MPERMLSATCRSRWLSSSAANSRSCERDWKHPIVRCRTRRQAPTSVLAAHQKPHHDRGGFFPLAGIAIDLAPARFGELVELGPPVVVGDAPRRRDQALLLQLEQCGVDRPVVDRQPALAGLLDAAGDAVAVLLAHGEQRAQHHQRQRALPPGFVFRVFLWRHHYWTPIRTLA